MNINEVKEGQEIKISFWNGDVFTGVVTEATEEYIAMNLDMCICSKGIKLSKEWIDDIELTSDKACCNGIEVTDDYLKILEKFNK
jgi:hypothetical protein